MRNYDTRQLDGCLLRKCVFREVKRQGCPFVNSDSRICKRDRIIIDREIHAATDDQHIRTNCTSLSLTQTRCTMTLEDQRTILGIAGIKVEVQRCRTIGGQRYVGSGGRSGDRRLFGGSTFRLYPCFIHQPIGNGIRRALEQINRRHKRPSGRQRRRNVCADSRVVKSYIVDVSITCDAGECSFTSCGVGTNHIANHELRDGTREGEFRSVDKLAVAIKRNCAICHGQHVNVHLCGSRLNLQTCKRHIHAISRPTKHFHSTRLRTRCETYNAACSITERNGNRVGRGWHRAPDCRRPGSVKVSRCRIGIYGSGKTTLVFILSCDISGAIMRFRNRRHRCA